MTPGVLTVGRPVESFGRFGLFFLELVRCRRHRLDIRTDPFRCALPTDRGERRLELRNPRRPQARVGPEHAVQIRQPRLVALEQLDLELVEPVNDLAPNHDLDGVEAQLHARVPVAQLASPPALANGDQLEQGCIASQFEHERAGI